MIDKDLAMAVIITTLLILLLTSGIILSFFVIGRQRIRQQMQMAEAKLAFEKELRTVEAEVSESVMSKFARELHDNIGQLLTALHIQVENLKIDHPELLGGFRPAEIYISEITQQLRMLSRTLNNDYLGHIGLLGAIQLETDRLKALKRFVIHYKQISGGTHLDKNQELMVFRIFQEIIANVLKHAGAKNLYVDIEIENEDFVLKVEDDGKGFDLDATMQSPKASGLKNILKRARLAGLDCQLSSKPGEGTLYIIKKIT
jgi:two-component system, NarL family, sensor kinase